MEAGNFRSLGVENSRGRVASKICKQTSKVRTANLLNIVHMSNILEEVSKLLGKGSIEMPKGMARNW
jgi:hypothetical protein